MRRPRTQSPFIDVILHHSDCSLAETRNSDLALARRHSHSAFVSRSLQFYRVFDCTIRGIKDNRRISMECRDRRMSRRAPRVTSLPLDPPVAQNPPWRNPSKVLESCSCCLHTCTAYAACELSEDTRATQHQQVIALHGGNFSGDLGVRLPVASAIYRHSRAIG